MVNLSRIDKNVYKSLGFKNKSIGQTMIKEVLQTKVTNFKTIPALVQHHHVSLAPPHSPAPPHPRTDEPGLKSS